MVRRSVRLGLRAGLLLAIIVAVAKVVHSLRGTNEETTPGWSTTPEPWTPPVPAPAEEASAGTAETADTAVAVDAAVTAAVASGAVASAPKIETPWVLPEDGRCPDSHPVKVKEGSRLFHLPGMLAYERTKPDRCYVSEAAALADGYTRAKR
jgi:hypothetical protein